MRYSNLKSAALAAMVVFGGSQIPAYAVPTTLDFTANFAPGQYFIDPANDFASWDSASGSVTWDDQTNSMISYSVAVGTSPNGTMSFELASSYFSDIHADDGVAYIGVWQNFGASSAPYVAIFQIWNPSITSGQFLKASDFSGANVLFRVDNGADFSAAGVAGTSYTVTSVPEPESMALMLLGLGALGVSRRQRT